MNAISEDFANSFTNLQKLWVDVKTGFMHFQENDVGIAKITPCFENRKSVIFTGLTNGYGAGTTELHIVRPIIGTILPEYILWFVKREDFILKGIKAFSGAVGQQRIRREHIEDTLLPLPPLAEQRRIIEVIKTAFNIINNIEMNKSTLFALIGQAKNKILDLAIHGKLTKQDQNDELASVLLQKIANQHGKSISENAPYRKVEGLFDIPASWEWVKLGNILNIISGTSYDKKDVVNAGIRILRGGNIQSGKVLLDDSDVFLPNSYADTKKAIKNGDIIIVASTGSKEVIGKAGFIFMDSNDIQIGAFLRIIRALSPEIVSYLWIIFSSKFYKQHIQNSVSGTNINNIKNEYITDFIVPLPPLSEQQRIVVAVETAFKQLDSILENFN
jgi:type I restriction enzyme S subunit